jgi:hypothetical protein
MIARQCASVSLSDRRPSTSKEAFKTCRLQLKTRQERQNGWTR